jgi:hypothetical protein
MIGVSKNLPFHSLQSGPIAEKGIIHLQELRPFVVHPFLILFATSSLEITSLAYFFTSCVPTHTISHLLLPYKRKNTLCKRAD